MNLEDEIDTRINYIFETNDVEAFGKESDDEEDLVLSEDKVESDELNSDDNYKCSPNKIVRTEKKVEQQPSTSAGHPKQYVSETAKNNSELRTKALESTGRSVTTRLPECGQRVKEMETPLEVWSLLFPDELLEIIVKYTNEKIEGTFNPDQQTDLTEIKAFIGLLYFAGLQEDRHKDTKKMWEEEGCTMYRAVMTRDRFIFLSSCIRFDDKTTRKDRQTADRLTAIREIWDLFIENCTKYYSPSQNCTVDEQLLEFEGNFFKTVYKLDEQAIQIFCLNDSKTFYMLNAIPYTGNVETTMESVCDDYMRLKDKNKTDEDTEKLEIVWHYNSTKNETYNFDVLCKRYSTSRKTMQWTMRLFFGMLDQGVVNSNILYNLVVEKNDLMNKYNFTKRLVLMLTAPHMQNHLQKRLQITLDIDLKSQSMIQSILKMNPQPIFENFRKAKCCENISCRKITSLDCILCKRSFCIKHCTKKTDPHLRQEYSFCFSCLKK
ncbi:piggyBac transposable element-derived protein 4 [Solenopsis invicta]|uniref:piggyBac transposable element-derived protein 4 n=1 Tax=Solenopsis invicta TaxID=13686 RepID=UPI000E33FBC5|nr:piggyBac transposable element-derived protein 4 [Solenopsis invicta]